MAEHPRTVLAISQPAPGWFRQPRPLGTSVVLGVGLVLALGSNDACAVAFGGVAGSTGMLAALITLVLMQGWAAHLAAPAMYAAGGVLLVAGGLAWRWSGRTARRPVGFVVAAGPTRTGAPPRATIQCVRPAAVITLPAGVERVALLAEMRLLFVRLQAAWDLAEMQSLRLLTTPAMFHELWLGSPSTGSIRGSTRTDVVTLQSELLGFDELAGLHLVSIEFSGLIREASDQRAVPFREIWILARSNVGDSGWRLARHQALL